MIIGESELLHQISFDLEQYFMGLKRGDTNIASQQQKAEMRTAQLLAYTIGRHAESITASSMRYEQ